MNAKELNTLWPDCNCPEYTRINVSWPTKGSAMILNASALKGSLSFTLRVIFSPLSGLRPVMTGISSGEGR